MTMILQPCEQVLVHGGRRELLEFGSCRHCVVVDWRDDVETILADVKRMLPEMDYRQVDDQTWEIRRHDKQHKLAAATGLPTELLLQSINRALLPEFEMRIFTPTMGDGYSLLLRPANWWREFSAAHGARCRKLFVTTDERVKVTGTAPGNAPQPWWRRLLGCSPKT